MKNFQIQRSCNFQRKLFGRCKKKVQKCLECKTFFKIFLTLSFPFKYIMKFQNWKSLEPPSSTPEGIKHMRPLTFFLGNLILNNFYLKYFFRISGIFGSVSPKVNLLSHFSILQYFKHGNFWNPQFQSQASQTYVMRSMKRDRKWAKLILQESEKAKFRSK